MGTPAEVHEGAVAVDGEDGALLGGVAVLVHAPRQDALYQFQFVGLVGEETAGFFLTDFLVDEVVPLGDDLPHTGLNLRQVLRGEGAREVKVVVEAGLNRRADGQFGRREFLQDGLGHYVRCGVADAQQVVVLCVFGHVCPP